MTQDELFKVLVAHCKEYGFIFPSSEIYDGLAAVYDYGQMGVELKNNIKQYWWNAMTRLNENIAGVDTCVFMHPKTWVASGHVAAFNDPLIDNKDSKKRYRADNLIEDYLGKIEEKMNKEVEKGRKRFGDAFDEEKFRQTNPNILREKAKYDEVHGRYVAAEAANDLKEYRQIIIDCGIVDPISGTANWTDVRQFIFRMREFEQMEMEFFCRPGTEMEWFRKWKETRMKWHVNLGMGAENYRFHDHEKLAHYANAATDIEFNFPFGFKELEGIHSRTDFDLGNHQRLSGKKIQYYDPETSESYVPYCVETSIGVDRMFLAVLSHSYKNEKLENGETRVVLSIPAPLAPVKCAVLPLVNKDGLPEMAQDVMNELKFDFKCQYDPKDSIGKRYRRQDAVGTPFCVTIDHESLNDGCVTLRERDSMEQRRIPVAELRAVIDKEVNMNNLLRTL